MNSSNSTIALEVHDLTVSYDQKPVLWDIDLTIPQGVLCGIIGPNGAGKSTLLKSIMGLLHTQSGYTKILDQPLDKVRKKVSYVPQRESVDWNFPASVLDVVLMGRYGNLGLFKRLKKSDKEIALQAIEDVGMSPYLNRQISQLSGGQQQRVFMARALAQEAQVYFMDEPFAGVDASTEQMIMEVLIKLRSEGKTVIVVHHDLQSASHFFDWAILINQRLIKAGPIAETFTQENLQETYGGRLTLLSDVTNVIKNQDFPIRTNH